MRQHVIVVSRNTFGHPEEKARAPRTVRISRRKRPIRSHFGCSIREIPFCKKEAAGGLISSDSTSKSKPMYQFAMKSKAM